MIEFLSGAVTFGYVVAAGFFFRYWRRTRDRLFLAFAGAFLLFALNQFLAAALLVVSEPNSLVYVLRVLGFLMIIGAIVDKNLQASPGSSPPSAARRR